MKASAIIVAAGSGVRLGSSVPKAFVVLGRYPLLYYSLRTIASVPDIDEVVVAAPSGMESRVHSIAAEADLPVPLKVAPGGIERQDSVRIALALTGAETECVIVHDAARPFAPAALFLECLNAAAQYGGAVAAIPVSDTLKRGLNSTISATLPRIDLYQAQTPQAFRRPLLIKAHERAAGEEIAATDDAELVERIGGELKIVGGSAINLKITTPADLEIARAIAIARESR
ncbi:MAG: 2-C-methyl-D-erythritol 4-phosphate cytidylyltransferase [Candidatus Binataceae bacterium]